jgi:ABC-type multidrug transport system permease subunit
MLSRLLRLYFRETWNGHNLAFLGVMLLLAAMLASGLPFASGGTPAIYQPVRLSIVDDDNSLISYTLADQFGDLSTVDKIYVESLESAKQRLDANEILLILVIPPNFYEDTVQGRERSSLTVYLNERMPAEAAIFVRLLKNMSASITAMQSSLFAYMDLSRPLFADEADFYSAADRASANLVFRLVGRQSIVQVDESSKFGTTLHVISSIACLLALLTGLLVLVQVQQERRHGLHERLLLAGVPGWQLLLAKMLIGMLWLFAGFAPLLAAFARFYPKLDLWPIVVAVILMYWIAALLGQALGYLGRPDDTALLAAWLALFLLLLLGGCIYPWPLLPDWLQWLGRISPARWGYLLVYRALTGQAFHPDAAIWLLVTTSLAGGLSLLAIRRARPVNS